MSALAVTLSQLESHLWEAANILRGPVDAADFKTYVFPLLFFKRISDGYVKGLLERWFNKHYAHGDLNHEIRRAVCPRR